MEIVNTIASVFLSVALGVAGGCGYRAFLLKQKAEREAALAKKKKYERQAVVMTEVGRQIASGNATIHGMGPGAGFLFASGPCTDPACPVHGTNTTTNYE